MPKLKNAPASVRNFLAEISTKIETRPQVIVFYGPPGLGKTSLGAAIPDAGFLIDDKELGIKTLKATGQASATIPVLPPVSEWSDVLECLRQIEAGVESLGWKTLVIDTIGGLERLCHAHVCRTKFGGDWGEKGFAGFGKGFEVALPEWRTLLELLERIRDRGVQIVALTHAIVKPFKNPLGEDFDRYTPDLHHKTWNLTHRWADLVAFGNYHVEVDSSGSRAKGKGGIARFFHCEHSAAYEAKNRHGIRRLVPMGSSGAEAWKNLTEAIGKGSK